MNIHQWDWVNITNGSGDQWRIHFVVAWVERGKHWHKFYSGMSWGSEYTFCSITFIQDDYDPSVDGQGILCPRILCGVHHHDVICHPVSWDSSSGTLCFPFFSQYPVLWSYRNVRVALPWIVFFFCGIQKISLNTPYSGGKKKKYSVDLINIPQIWKKNLSDAIFGLCPSITMTTLEDDKGSGRGSDVDDTSESFYSDEPQEIGGGQLFVQMFFVVTL